MRAFQLDILRDYWRFSTLKISLFYDVVLTAINLEIYSFLHKKTYFELSNIIFLLILYSLFLDVAWRKRSEVPMLGLRTNRKMETVVGYKL